MKKRRYQLWLAMAVMVLWVLPLRSQDKSAETVVPLIDPDLPLSLTASNINDHGDITGVIGGERNMIGFLRTSDGQYQEILFAGDCGPQHPAARCIAPHGINNRGQIVGSIVAVFRDFSGGFLREKDGTMKILPHTPANSIAFPNGINDRGVIVGNTDHHGFLLDGGGYTIIDFPGAEVTECWAINNSGVVTGSFTLPSRETFGFLWQKGNFISTFQVSDSNGAINTFPNAINDLGQVAGTFATIPFVDPIQRRGNFLRNMDGSIKIINLNPLLRPFVRSTHQPFTVFLAGINNRGDLVGSFTQVLDTSGFLIPRGAALDEKH